MEPIDETHYSSSAGRRALGAVRVARSIGQALQGSKGDDYGQLGEARVRMRAVAVT